FRGADEPRVEGTGTTDELIDDPFRFPGTDRRSTQGQRARPGTATSPTRHGDRPGTARLPARPDPTRARPSLARARPGRAPPGPGHRPSVRAQLCSREPS